MFYNNIQFQALCLLLIFETGISASDLKPSKPGSRIKMQSRYWMGADDIESVSVKIYGNTVLASKQKTTKTYPVEAKSTIRFIYDNTSKNCGCGEHNKNNSVWLELYAPVETKKNARRSKPTARVTRRIFTFKRSLFNLESNECIETGLEAHRSSIMTRNVNRTIFIPGCYKDGDKPKGKSELQIVCAKGLAETIAPDMRSFLVQVEKRIAKDQAKQERIAKDQAKQKRIAEERAKQELIAEEQAKRERAAEKERIAREPPICRDCKGTGKYCGGCLRCTSCNGSRRSTRRRLPRVIQRLLESEATQ